MRIGFEAKRLFNNRTGLGNYSRGLVSALGEFYPEHQYYLYTSKFDKGIDFPLGKNMAVHSPTGIDKLFGSWWRSTKLGGVAKGDKLDIFHGLSHELPRDIEKAGLKSVVTVHDLIHIKFPEQFHPIDRKIYDAKVRHACQAANLIIAISEQTKQDLVELYHLQEEKIAVVYQHCQDIFMQQVPEEKLAEVSSQYQLPSRYLLYVGALNERKNLLNLIKAFELVQEPDLHLLLVGSGSGYQQLLAKYIRERPLKQVRIISGVPTVDLPALYKMAEIFVYPSLYEGFGLPIIEAQYCGTPVITTQGGCFEEAGGNAALYLPTHVPEVLAEGISSLLTDTDLRYQMHLAGMMNAYRFRPEVSARQMMEQYLRL
ncbi:MAG: glycosyltransferase family 1 protein [Chitinophagales bacterium]|nr:glycosyltransferase family 1 protein [Chitinophagales bacterium]